MARYDLGPWVRFHLRWKSCELSLAVPVLHMLVGGRPSASAEDVTELLGSRIRPDKSWPCRMVLNRAFTGASAIGCKARRGDLLTHHRPPLASTLIDRCVWGRGYRSRGNRSPNLSGPG